MITDVRTALIRKKQKHSPLKHDENILRAEIGVGGASALTSYLMGLAHIEACSLTPQDSSSWDCRTVRAVKNVATVKGIWTYKGQKLNQAFLATFTHVPSYR